MYLWLEQDCVAETLHPQIGMDDKVERTTDKLGYIGIEMESGSKKTYDRQHGHVQDASKNNDIFYRSDAFLRQCFDAGQSMFVLIAPLNTNDKSVITAMESQLMQLMWSLNSKTRTLKNDLLSNISQRDVNYVKCMQILRYMIEFGDLWQLTADKINGKNVHLIDRKMFDFGSVPKRLLVAYDAEKLIHWLCNDVFTWDSNLAYE